MGYVDLRGLWYRGRYSVGEYSQIKNLLKGKLEGFGFLSSRRQGPNEFIVFEYPFDDKLAKMVQTFCIDQQSLMVTSRKVTGHLVADGQYCEGFTSELKWKSIQDLQVPIEAKFSDASQIGIDGEIHRGVVKRNFEIDWIGLNEPPQRSLFSESALSDVDWMMAHLKGTENAEKEKPNRGALRPDVVK